MITWETTMKIEYQQKAGEIAGMLSTEDFQTVQEMVSQAIGVNLTETKKALVVSRLSKRLRELNLKSFTQYLQLVRDSPDEVEVMFNYLTTNVTRFFREKHHFDYLCREYLPQRELNAGENPAEKRIRAWSAGCSTGEEPYTLAIVLNDYFQSKKGWSIDILASDVNTAVLEKACTGVYTRNEVEGVPYACLKKYFKLGVGQNEGLFKVKEALQNTVKFRQINLTSARKYPAAASLNMILCRNVFIYFDRKTRSKVLEQFHRSLRPGGLLFLGHSESINTLDGQAERWRMVQHTVYKRMP